MNRFIKLVLAAALCFTFCVGVCACGQKDGKDDYSAPAGDDYGEDIF